MRCAWPAVGLCAAMALCGCGAGEKSSDGATQPTATAESSAGPRSVMVDHVTKVEGSPPRVTTPGGAPPSKLKIADLEKGAGVAAKRGDELTVQFVAIHYVNGKPFESSWESGETLTFTLEPKSVSPGWVKGLQGMKVGGRRELVVPAGLTSRVGSPPAAGSAAALIYVIDLLEARRPGATTPATTRERAKPILEVPKSPPPKKLIVKDVEKGYGPPARDGDELTIHYVNAFYLTGEQLSPGSWGFGEPLTFTLGSGEQLPGWELGLKGMRAGGRRELLVPARLSSPFGPSSSNNPLAYIVDLLEIKSPSSTAPQ